MVEYSCPGVTELGCLSRSGSGALGHTWGKADTAAGGVNRGLSRTFSNVPNTVVQNVTEDGDCTELILLRVFAGGCYRSSSKTLKTEVSQRKHT